MENLIVPQGTFQLARYPQQHRTGLRPWDAADEYLLQQLAAKGLPNKQGTLLILNDGFGALSVALAGQHPQMASDSFLAQQGTRANLEANGLPADQVQLLDSLQTPRGPVDLLVIKIPKTLALLEDQLHRIRPLLHADTRIIGAGMTKNIHTSTLKLFERIIGPTHTSLARKKARLIFCRLDRNLSPGTSPYPTTYTLKGTGYQIINHANVFSREGLDIGSRFLLQHMPGDNGARCIIDLGCGNGILGLMAAVNHPDAELLFVDESHMAVASAEANFRAAFGDSRPAKFKVTNCLDGIASNAADLILNNPPFHQQHAVGDFIAWQMFKESRRVLTPGGELRVVGNRHLGYHAKLKKLFGNCDTIAGNRKFVILRALKAR